MKSSIAIIVCNQSEEAEVIFPLDLWRRAGLFVATLSIEKKKNLTLQNGLKISCDDFLDRENLSKYNLIYLPGIIGCKAYLDQKCKKLQNFLQKNMNNNSSFSLAAACASPAILSKLNIINSLKTTVYPTMKNDVKKYVDHDVVCDKKFISTKAAGTIYDFSLFIIKKFLSEAMVSKIANEICYKHWK